METSVLFESEVQIRVRYSETDQMGVVYHGRYIEYYEVARVEALREMGLNYAEMEKSGVMLPVMSVQIDYKASAYYDEVLTVKVRVRDLPTVKFPFEYEMYNEKGILLNTGKVMLAFMNKETRRPMRAPADVIAILEKLNK